jgi:hypothetical protein
MSSPKEVIEATLRQCLMKCSPIIEMDVPKVATAVADALQAPDVLAKAHAEAWRQAASDVPTENRMGGEQQQQVPVKPAVAADDLTDAGNAVDFAEQLLDDLEALSDDPSKHKGIDFFDSVYKDAKELADRVDQRGFATEGEASALKGWRGGVDKWMN